MKLKRLVLLILVIALVTSACGLTAQDAVDIAGDIAGELLGPGTPDSEEPGEAEVPPEPEKPGESEELSDTPEATEDAAGTEDTQPEDTQPTEPDGPVYGEYYYDVENVVLYLEAYGELPGNFITKKEAGELGWSGGSVEDYMEGAAIGGDRFGNYEGLLPKAKGRTYTECDIDTLGYGSRGARRLVFSNDGLYFYTSDHYESFSEVTVKDGKVSW